jgi:hypothetical protein
MRLAAGGPAPYGRYPPRLSAACINPPSKAALPIRPNWPTALIALEGGQARRLPLLYKPKRTRMSRVRMPVMTKVTTVPTMPAIWTSRRC